MRVHIEQVFANLISNARWKYLGTTRTRAVESAPKTEGAFVEFRCATNGIGIDPGTNTRVFELFQRLREVEAEGARAWASRS